MKKLLLLGGFSFLALGLTAQERLVLYEEFTGENCPPCATYNPGLMDLVNQQDNVLIIKYQSPIPSAGPIYYQNTAPADTRRGYYSVSSAPHGLVDGAKTGLNTSAPGHIAYTTANELQAAANVPTSIDVEIINFNRTMGNPAVTFDVKVTSTVAQTLSNASLHVAVIENLLYGNPPGTNGETEFYNVVREMYPSPSGQAVQPTFAANQSQVFSITADLPSYVDPNSKDIRFVAFVQDDTDKKILNATVTATVEKDVYATGLSSPHQGQVSCGTISDVAPTSTFKNIGNETITSIEMYYRTTDGTNTSQWVSGTWTGNLQPGHSASYTFNGLPGLEGVYLVQDSIGKINGQAPENEIMKSNSMVLTSIMTNPLDIFPYSSSFETNEERQNVISLGINGGEPMGIYEASGRAYNGGDFFLGYLNYFLESGQGVAIMPYMNLPEGKRALDFYVAYAQYTNENDKLEVVYSEDCGQTWTSVWSKSGADLSTVAPTQQQFIPNGNHQWRKESVDITDIPNGAYVGFRGTSDYGNHLFVDNINMRAGDVDVSTNELMNETNLIVYPNPTNADINLRINSELNGAASVSVYDIMGREVYNVDMNLSGSAQVLTLPVNHLPAGIYSIQLATEKGSRQVKFTKK